MIEKFVIQYSTGLYDSFCEHIYTMEAESKEQIEIWLLEAFEKYRIDFKKKRGFEEEFKRASFKNPIALEFHKRYQKIPTGH